ncbi:helix-turn-helix transcriptional regulator [Terrarubrum flagellatum]|uniref:helix-turn-helix transcriptional regulator n=1 Tax=Terrirubrum flagellatum TaxID=2895980 RepID=UPI0031453133
MALLERDISLKTLGAALESAIGGVGQTILVSGEAGIGKTSLIDHFVVKARERCRVIRAHCDSLFTPAPLAPLHDIADQLDKALRDQLSRDISRSAIFASVMAILRSLSGAILIFEDIHWADEATLDLIRYLSRRIDQCSILLILTYRDDELGCSRPLRILLGDFAACRTTVRIRPERLSLRAVKQLAGDASRDCELIHRQSSGNPFYVAELLRHEGQGLPPTVHESVLARVARLSAGARQALEMAAVLGSRVDLALLERAIATATEDICECEARGLTESVGRQVSFRHELIRDAVLASLDPGRRREHHRKALAILSNTSSSQSDLSRLAYFADQAGDADALVAYGTAAAQMSAKAGAHRAAAALCRKVLDATDSLEPEAKAEMLNAYAEESSIIDELDQANEARREAVELWLRQGEMLRAGETLAASAWPLARSGRNAEADQASLRAIEMLEKLPAGSQLASAYQIQAHLRMMDRDIPAAVSWGEKAVALASQFHDSRTVSAAELVVGSALLVGGDARGRAHLDSSMRLAKSEGLDALVGIIYSNLGASYGEQYQFEEAERHLLDGLKYANDRDLDHATHYQTAWLALVRFYQGRWREAAELAESVVQRPSATISRIVAWIALGRIWSRQGAPGAASALNAALELASQSNSLQRLAPARSARAEAAWFAGDDAQAIEEARSIYDLAEARQQSWHVGELAYWLWKAGRAVKPPACCAAPFALQIRGEWREAAKAWERMGCPYEHARALSEGDSRAKFAALDIFDRLGAEPAAANLRRRMRGDGVQRIPRGPRSVNRGSPHSLTQRELQILGLLQPGMTNMQIADALRISPKTVDHHVSSILSKMGVSSRMQAASKALEEQIVAAE